MVSKMFDFDLKTGFSKVKPPMVRYANQMENMYADQEALEKAVKVGNPKIYEFYDMGIKPAEGNLAFGTSILEPGLIGEEFYMTKGHFHTILDTSEVYYCLSGYGMMLMENPEGDVEYQVMKKGEAVFVPGRYAHRSINLSLTERLVTFFVFRADAGHDYGTIETKGFRKIVLRDASSPDGFKVVDNPKWKDRT